MSFMPNPGTLVVLRDGRQAIVSKATPLGDDDRVRFSDGHEETITYHEFDDVGEEAPFCGPVFPQLPATEKQ